MWKKKKICLFLIKPLFVFKWLLMFFCVNVILLICSWWTMYFIELAPIRLQFVTTNFYFPIFSLIFRESDNARMPFIWLKDVSAIAILLVYFGFTRMWKRRREKQRALWRYALLLLLLWMLVVGCCCWCWCGCGCCCCCWCGCGCWW